MDIKILGSVSPYAKDGKNGPGFLIYKGNNKVLLDCGPGITNQLSFPDDLENLNIIISHLHYDHFSDLLTIAYASHVYHKLGNITKRIKVYIPKMDHERVYEDYKDTDGWSCSRLVEQENKDQSFLTNLHKSNYFEVITYDSKEKLKIGELEVSFSKNPHDIKSHSIKITDDENSIVYSGDTGYKNNTLQSFAQNVDLLICESTYIKGQFREKDYHLYAHEAATIAKQSNSKKLVLMHFWPEIDKNLYLKEALPIFESTEVAKEGKILRLHK